VSSDETTIEQGHELAWNSSQEQLQSSSSASGTQTKSVEDDSTVKGVGRPRKLDWDKLRAREVDEDPSKDERVPHFRALLHQQPPGLTSEQAEEVLDIFKMFAQFNADEVNYPRVESVSNEFDRWKAKVGLAHMTEEHFSSDVRRCTMQIINSYQLHQSLTFNSEGQWKQNHSDYLISRDSDVITPPKPDLAISFKLEAFNKSAPIPSILKKAFRPDSAGQKYARCFPFLFFEAKRADDSLETACMANLHSASQALLNIYAWMMEAQQAETFFEKVRVFTFVCNAQELSLRMHRATRHEVTLLQYHFVELVDFSKYSKDQACLLVRNILDKYAIDELHPILKSAFDIVTEEKSRAVEERRAAFVRTTTANRVRSRATNLPIEQSTSFGISGFVDIGREGAGSVGGALAGQCGDREY
jgi:hypothetical protein